MSNVPTLREIDYAIKALKDALSSVETAQGMTQANMIEKAKAGDYGDAADLRAVSIGLSRGETCIRIEIETLEHRRVAVEAHHKRSEA